MRTHKQSTARGRQTRFEAFEQRLAMSAQPVALLADSAAPSAAAEEQYAEIAPALENALEAFDPALVQHVLTSNQLNTAHQLTGLEQARAAYGLTGSGQTVVVIDSGIAYDHQALGGGFGTGYRVVGGWDFAENDADPYDDGPAGFHGTHVAGILGSSDATYSGVAPGVDIVALRVFDDRGAGSFSWTEQALQWVHLHRNDFENPITTINLSLGAAWNSHAPPNWATLEDEFAQLESDGIFISVSAGNSFATYNAKGLSYPAASSYVVPVASVDTNGNLSSFSQRHDRVIAAPGRNITSTVPDYVFGADGIKNDYVAASGTSMAAPYVAGAATLIREAMQFVGIQNITQDKIYDTMWSTADLVYDAVTNGHYHRLNVLRALESVLPADDAGSTAATARSLGNVGTSTSFSGLINARGDIDVISFTAGMSGRMSMAFDTASNLNLRAELLGGQSSFANQVLSFDVTAGTTYAVAIRGGEDVGHYDAHAELRVAAQAIGAVDLRQLAGVQVQGEAWYQVTAVRSGTFTALASFANGAGNVDLRICDAQHQLIASAQTQADWERLDVQVTAGQTLYVCLQGYNSDVDLTLANLVQNQGSTVRVFGTAANDQFTLTSGSQVTIAVQGVQYQFAATAVGVVEFQGGEGADTATITGSAGNLQLRWNDVQVVGGNHGGSEGENSGGSSGSSGVGTELARKAYDLDQQYGFKFGGSYHANWGVPGAKWIQDKAGGWWFLLNDGRLFQWNGTTRFMTSKHVATLDASYNADPRKLYDAEPPAETGSGANSGGGTNSGSEARNGADTGSGTGQTGGDGTNNGTGGTQGGGSSQGSSGTGGSSSSGSNSNGAAITDVQRRAIELDQRLNLRSSGNYQTNWARLNEKWIVDQAGKWYFIIPDGRVYAWNGSLAGARSSPLIATLDASYYAQPGKLHEAAEWAQQQRATAQSVLATGPAAAPAAGVDSDWNSSVDYLGGVERLLRVEPDSGSAMAYVPQASDREGVPQHGRDARTSAVHDTIAGEVGRYAAFADERFLLAGTEQSMRLGNSRSRSRRETADVAELESLDAWFDMLEESCSTR